MSASLLPCTESLFLDSRSERFACRWFLVKMVPKSSCSSKWLLLASKHKVSPMKTQRYTRSFFPPFSWHRFFTARANLSAHVESGKNWIRIQCYSFPYGFVFVRDLCLQHSFHDPKDQSDDGTKAVGHATTFFKDTHWCRLLLSTAQVSSLVALLEILTVFWFLSFAINF